MKDLKRMPAKVILLFAMPLVVRNWNIRHVSLQKAGVLFLVLLLVFGSAPSGEAAAMTRECAASFGLDADTDCFVYVNAHDRNRATVAMYRLTKKRRWKRIFKTQGYVGAAGVGAASEGSTCTPEGVYHFTKLFGILENPGTQLPYTRLRDSHVWVDDPGSRYYNQFVDTSLVRRDWNSAEQLAACRGAYDYVAAFDYNRNCVPGKGSAFFLHCTQWTPTGGCVSIPKTEMVRVLRRLTGHSQIVIKK